jgi:hypothetical protein
MVRELLECVEVKGGRCLDIGTQEALISVSLARLGAGQVVAYDRLDLTSRINLVKQAYGVDFDYLSNIQLSELSDALRRTGHAPFDLVVFAGVLYHMIDPLAGLGIARSFAREKGLVLVETSAIVSNDKVLYFNDAGSHRPYSCYFLPSLGWLDYCLRMLRLRPIDCRHISSPTIGSSCRVAVMCRAEDRPIALSGDDWMTKPWVEHDFRAVSLDYAALASRAPEVGCDVCAEPLRFHEETTAVDVFETVRQSRPWKRNEMKARLNLADYMGADFA